VIVPAKELEKDPLENAVALMDLNEAIEKNGAVSRHTHSWDVSMLCFGCFGLLFL